MLVVLIGNLFPDYTDLFVILGQSQLGHVMMIRIIVSTDKIMQNHYLKGELIFKRLCLCLF